MLVSQRARITRDCPNIHKYRASCLVSGDFRDRLLETTLQARPCGCPALRSTPALRARSASAARRGARATAKHSGEPNPGRGAPGRENTQPQHPHRPILMPLCAGGKQNVGRQRHDINTTVPVRRVGVCEIYYAGWSEYLYIVCLGKTAAAHFGSNPP